MTWFKRDGVTDITRINKDDTSIDRKFKGVYAAWAHAIGFDVVPDAYEYEHNVKDTDKYCFPRLDFLPNVGISMDDIDTWKFISNWDSGYLEDVGILMDNTDVDGDDERYLKTLKNCYLLCDLTADEVGSSLDKLAGGFRINLDDSNLYNFGKRVDTILTQLSDLSKDNTLSVDEKLDCLMVAAYELRVDTGEIDIRDKRKREFFSEYTDRILSKESDFFHINDDKDTIIFDENTFYSGSPDGTVEYHNLGSITDGENRMLEKCFEKGYSGEEAFDVNNRYYFPFVEWICYRGSYSIDGIDDYGKYGIDCEFDKIGENIAKGLESGCLTPYDDNFCVSGYTGDSYLGYKDYVEDRAHKLAKDESEFNEMVDCMDSFSISELMRGTAKYNRDEEDMLYNNMLCKIGTLCRCGVDMGNLVFLPGIDNIKINTEITDDIMVKLAGYARLDDLDFSYVDGENKLCDSEGSWDFIAYFTKTQDGKERVEKFNKEYGADWVNRQLKTLSEKDNPMKDVDDYIRGLDDSDKETIKDFED